MNVSGSLLQQWFGQSVQWDFSVHRKSGRQLRVQRDDSQPVWRSRKMWYEAALTMWDSTTHIKHHIFLELVAWHFGRPLAFSKRWKRGGNVICGATPFLQLRLNQVLNVHDFTFSWYCINFGMLLQLNGKGGREKVPDFGLTVVLIASCSLFHLLPSLGRKVI